jgi:exopolysaccharide biosynthesis polyprenyl glycosylphosphotransferase
LATQETSIWAAAVNPLELTPARSSFATERFAAARRPLNRGQVLLRGLVVADVSGLSLAFLVTLLIFGFSGRSGQARPVYELLVFFVTLPAWMLLASAHGLYRDGAGRIGHSTVDELVGVVHVVTLGAWMFFVASWVTAVASPRPAKLIGFWALATVLITTCRALTRHWCARHRGYMQNAIIVGAGDVGQLVARKLLQHREYGIRLLGVVDDAPRERRADLGDVRLLGDASELSEIVSELDVHRVVVAFSKESDQRTVDVVRQLRGLDVQVDVVPRLYELVGPRADVHTVEGLPLIGLPAMRWSRTAILVKRAIDVVTAAVALALLAPLFALIAWKIRRTSPGPIFFRQTRLGLNMREFTVLKFRTMWQETDDHEHRAYIEQTMSSNAPIGANGLYKLNRENAVTPFGRWLRRTSLDELPQLINVLRGEMSLVGPRPCIPYETRHFKPHHFERFLLPQGLTGLWQVTARAQSTFGEALDLDVAYVRGWSLGLDLRLVFRTPLMLIRQGGTA